MLANIVVSHFMAFACVCTQVMVHMRGLLKMYIVYHFSFTFLNNIFIIRQLLLSKNYILLSHRFGMCWVALPKPN